MKKYSDVKQKINEASEQEEAYNNLLKTLGRGEQPLVRHLGDNRLAISSKSMFTLSTEQEHPVVVKVEGFLKEEKTNEEDASLTEEIKKEILDLYSDWSGGFTPEEDADNIYDFVGAALPEKYQSLRDEIEVWLEKEAGLS